ncbi:hypothetical protein AWB78_05485 [Caballeronia calidae]|uniref:Uncharacterized protein n=1 Tax=Caballeronia calidae TaxID=1777139 RepID=A0A158DQW3_9BURK|nr:hypothetical protein [Caballeronia calidae]SAK96965.1 hypothetical protein AWB78_05485 [Caballeronia calidae]
MYKIKRSELVKSAHPLAGGAAKVENSGNVGMGNITIGDVSTQPPSQTNNTNTVDITIGIGQL